MVFVGDSVLCVSQTSVSNKRTTSCKHIVYGKRSYAPVESAFPRNNELCKKTLFVAVTMTCAHCSNEN